MKEIGGYLELDTYKLPMLHENAIALNCGRNCLAYLIKARKITKIKVPYFMCDSVFEVCEKYGAKVSFYHIDKYFKPLNIDLAEDEWLYVMNYYGQLTSAELTRLKDSCGRIIVDNAHAYFDMPIPDIDTLYTCRKFFGVADGAFLYSNSRLDEDLRTDESFDRMIFLLGRFERTASEFYGYYQENNNRFADEPIKRMSKLTNNLLHGIDYSFVKQRRTENFRQYHISLREINELKIQMSGGAFAYPLLIKNGALIRKALQQKKIYIPTLWPNVVCDMPKDSLEYRFANDILPLPCDQRYGTEEIQYIIKALGEAVI